MPEEKERKFERVLAVFAHPDDPEFSCGATVAKLAGAGAEVRYVVCTDGSQGGEDPKVPDEVLVATREAEQCDAARVLGVQGVCFLRYRDGHLTPSLEVRRDIVREIRKHRPDLVITHNPLFQLQLGASHPDHLATGQATMAAVYPDSRNPRAFRDLLEEGLAPHRVKEVWIPAWEGPEHFVEITPELFELKLQAILAHKSQFEKPNQDPENPPEKWLRERMRQIGEQGGYEYAEGFKRIELMP
jgi:LmbE family N-acetylglucosaminyl deacetylase